MCTPNLDSFRYFPDQYTFLLYFERETTGCIERLTCINIKANPMYCSLWGDFFILPWRKILYPAIYVEVKHIDATAID